MTIQTKRVLQAVVIGVMGLGAYAMAEGQTPDANQVPQTAAQVQADAVRRSDLMPAETTYGFAGYGEKGFFIRDTDKYFSLNLGAFAQFRNVSCIIGEHEGSKVVYANGFEWRRLELSAEGNMFKDLNYVLVAEYIPGQQGPNPALRWDANYSGIRVQTAYVSYEFQNFDLGAFGGGSYALPFPVTIRGGQFKDPTIRESSLSSKYQMAVDRSFQNTWIGGAWTGENYIQGIGFNAGGTKDDVWRAELDIHEGPRTGNTDWTDPINPNTKNWGISTRGEYKISGSWKDYSAFTTKGKTQGEELLIVGGGIAWSEPDSAYVARHPVTRVNSLRYIDREINVSVDGTWKPNIDGLPIGVFGAITGQFIDIDSYQTPGDDSFCNWGFLAQGSYLFNDSFEAFARVGMTSLDDVAAYDRQWFSEWTIGGNWYLGEKGRWGHRAKVTVDGSLLPQGTPMDASGAGAIESEGGTLELILRAQLQLIL